MLALCLMLLGTYYAQNYAGIIGRSLAGSHRMLQNSCYLQFVNVPQLVLNECTYLFPETVKLVIHGI